MTTTGTTRPNPYVGPRAFRRGEALYGRDREKKRLLNLLIAERIVLLCSPSGAGKTSLVQAALIPELEGEGFTVLPVIRLNRTPPPADLQGIGVSNRYILSLLLSLEERLPPELQMPLADLAELTLRKYLKTRAKTANAPDEILIFDQFEES
jgi:MoxR-like ATPase